jgi:glyoxylase-like metal-dependent hydrolase (beta-lactamase superfamily II)
VLRALAPGLHVVERPLRFMGVEIGTRATVVTLESGELLVHSPVRFGEDLRAAVAPLGPVRHLVAPCRMHHLALADWARAYPGASLHAAPGLAKKRPDLRFATVLDDVAPRAWAGQLAQVLLLGAPRYNEIAFLHRASGTLLLADALFGWGPEDPPLTRLTARIFGAYGRWARPHNPIFGAIVQPAALRESIERVLAWDFDRIVICHGRIVERGGREVLREAYRFLLDGRRSAVSG